MSDSATRTGAIEPWSCTDGTIRVTPSGQPSVFDMIRVLGGQKNPRDVWKRVLKQKPQVVEWIQYHKFPGRGQRSTPVLAAIERFDELKELACVPPYQKKIRIYRSLGATCINEPNVQAGYAMLLSECGSVRQYVPCGSGVIDIVTEISVIEVKQVSLWKAAIGQAIAYATDLNLFPEIALFGDYNYAPILNKCTSLNIGCYGLMTSNGDAKRFIRGYGAPSCSNHEELIDIFGRLHRARLN